MCKSVEEFIHKEKGENLFTEILIDVTNGKVCANGTASVPKSVLPYTMDKVKVFFLGFLKEDLFYFF